ncbi:MAG TPA: hypothetical protein VII25_12485 [Candidatus Acidoferrum sp.]
MLGKVPVNAQTIHVGFSTNLSGTTNQANWSGCKMASTIDMLQDQPKVAHKLSPKRAIVFALIWLGEVFLILLFVKRVVHGSSTIYLLLVPWALLGLIMMVRPNWIPNPYDIDEKTEQKWKKWNPPGFP